MAAMGFPFCMIVRILSPFGICRVTVRILSPASVEEEEGRGMRS